MHELLYHRQLALEDSDLRGYAKELGLDAARFDSDRAGSAALERVQRDVRSGDATGEVLGTPTLFINGIIYRGPHDAESFMAALGLSSTAG